MGNCLPILVAIYNNLRDGGDNKNLEHDDKKKDETQNFAQTRNCCRDIQSIRKQFVTNLLPENNSLINKICVSGMNLD